MDENENFFFERPILYPYGKIELNDESEYPTRQLLIDVAHGNYIDALLNEECQNAFQFIERSEEISNSTLGEFYKQNFKAYLEAEGKLAEKIVFCIGVSCLQLFVQNNFCGPVIGPSHTFIPNLIPVGSNEAEVRERGLEELVLNTDGIYDLVSHPELLILARVVFLDLQNCLSSFISTNWWCFRYAIVHQKIVDESSGTLGDIIFRCLDTMEKSTIIDKQRFSDLYALFHLEAANCSLFYFKVNRAEVHINNALFSLGIKINEYGDLIVRNHTLREPKNYDYRHAIPTSYYHGNINPDTVICSLTSIEHMAIFAKIVLLDRSEDRSDELINNYKLLLKSIFKNSKNWALRLSLIFHKFRDWFYETDFAEKSPAQINDFLESIESNMPSGYIRLRLIYSSSLLTKWNLLKERMNRSCGYVESSLQMYEKLHLWDALILSYKKLKMKEKFVDIIKKLLEENETAELWCLLGDATDDISYYNKALKVKNGNSYRAHRSLGDYFFRNQEYNLAVNHYKYCIEKNRHKHDMFRKLIYCITQSKMWDECVVYSKKYLTDSDDFDGWSSLTRAYINLGEHENALKALKEVLRFKEDYTLLNDFVVVGTLSGYVEDALDAFENILKCKNERFDLKELENFASSIIKKKDSDGIFMKSLYKKLLQIVNKICRRSSKDPDSHFLYAELLFGNPEGNIHEKNIAIQYYRRSVAIYAQFTGWEMFTDEKILIISRCLKLIKLYHENIDFSHSRGALFNLNSLQFLIRRIIESITKKYVSNIDSLMMSLKSLEYELKNLENLAKELRS